MHYLGIDYGLRYVGLSLGDDETRLATPFKTIDQAHGHFFDTLTAIVKDESIEGIVIGMPRHQVSNEQEEETRTFIEQLRVKTDIPIYEQDERLTSQESQRRIREGSTADEHSIAAMLILQSYFDAEAL